MMKKVSVMSFLLVLSVSGYGQSAMFQSSIGLNDGQERVMSHYYADNPAKELEEEIAQKHIVEALNTPLLKAIGVSGFENDVITAIHDNIVGCYSDERFNPVIYRVRIFYNDEFNKFLHKIIKSEKVRDVLFNLAANIISDLCRLYPKDYRAEVINRLTKAKDYVSTMSRHRYEAVNLDTWMEEQKLYIDGKENEEIALGIEGFLIRRVITDGFTISELAGYIDNLLSRVKAIGIDGKDDVLKSVNVNNDLTFYTTATGQFYVANRTGVKIYPYKTDDWYLMRHGDTQLQCIKDTDSNLYRISNGFLASYPEEHWELYTHPDVKGVILVDNKGEIIYREE